MRILTIVAAIVAFGIIIFIHELGHFLMARAMKVRVNEFAIGMGPKLFSFGKKETVYSLRLFPIGGFCAMEGEDEGVETPRALGGNTAAADTEPTAEEAPQAADSRSFSQKKVWQRMLITVAGAVMNLILGFLLLIPYFAISTPPNSKGEVLYGSTTLSRVPETAMSYKTGLRSGDTILNIDGTPIISQFDLISALQSDEDGVFNMVVRREVDGEQEKVNLEGVTFEIKVNEETGARTLIYDFTVLGVEQNVWTTIAEAAKTEVSLGLWVWNSLGDLITGKYGLNDLSGPIGTVDVMSEAVTDAVKSDGLGAGISYMLYLMSLITVNLGIFNLLPIPALDGGRLVFLIAEGITRRRVPPKVEGIINIVGLALLMLLMIVVAGSDIFKIFT